MLTTTNTEIEITASDNSHIFGIPFVIHQEDYTSMVINRKNLRDWIDRVEFLQNAGLEFQFHYK